ncbi:hypothetical protein A3K48_07935 [candidate division WOR-1 bacterium RIFOXYA12_FULL_52_29]|uniref:4Fe-4S ferredoxin-type domain-containing protein n=1 Tax=candidate division WOR-1 bacterium RIFOXYC12_FULL_54_18 TaxID=1802584 RepID=A0A1F4T8F6_UNCSA|nr:MAG: hypothetical protein A3K44_07935 [candidate division WOR-1 bacterium RIFOXYA2_FULL_51_19]OGC18440.1 MAG: hypothetical protein A3K48_07935 [candidate division WOR-1 bacterium RIFOXYA12_FULL_52_29]OGC27294.1 MAG: hypothetical protein A3K32_07930 [candidate division WOR-1 bacterium RIFOXYB2_FULL_45_9]OGC28857.1 MAG: hypothetical protein A3K49_07935 [candidate division WOR-1 bacterium RIFOXYC12_FULL_54_18]OGC30634.1 MAG: hypothetical protein A2346_00040 [candidate division WOR-1 bacterium R
MATKVSLVKCGSYADTEVAGALRSALAPFGGMAALVKPGQKVLIKPNCLMGEAPEMAVTTHPTLIFAVVKEVIAAGGIALVGDSPGNAHANVVASMEKAGIKQAAEAAGGALVPFQQGGIVKVKSPSGSSILPEVPIAGPVLAADFVIDLPKLKTHGMTLYTGAIKNMFGCVPGFFKTEFHRLAPHPHDFASLLVDVFAISRPGLTIMDAVVGMEGAGPSHGTPRKLGAIIASTDGVAVDVIGSSLIGFDPLDIDMIKIAGERGLGNSNLEQIEVLGAAIAELRLTDWARPDRLYKVLKRFPRLAGILAGFIAINPEIDQQKCVKCLVCLKSCPAKTIKMHPHPLSPSPLPRGKGNKGLGVYIDLKNCIHCFCCHELCQYDAVKLKSSWLARLMGVA